MCMYVSMWFNMDDWHWQNPIKTKRTESWTLWNNEPVCFILFCSCSNPTSREAALIGRAEVAQSLPSQARLSAKHRVVDQNKGSHHVVLQHYWPCSSWMRQTNAHMYFKNCIDLYSVATSSPQPGRCSTRSSVMMMKMMMMMIHDDSWSSPH